MEETSMKTRILVTTLLGAAAFNAHATLQSWNTLFIQNDAVTSFTATSSGWDMSISSDGPLVDSFFAMGGGMTKEMVGSHYYAYIDGVSAITLNGAVNPTVGSFDFLNALGGIDSGGQPGFSILSASGDTASINMGNLKWDWNGIMDVPMSTGAWSPGYSNGVGNLTCAAGSGCAVGSAYTLQYTATVPRSHPSGLGDLKYYYELHGTVGAVPEASTYAMMLAGLGLVGVAARRRKPIRL
jgi:hypothetical protein